MNFVGQASQLRTLLTGDISDNLTYGADFTPDWDGSNLEDSKPLTTGVPGVFTNYNPYGNYAPSRLDYIIYSGSAMSLQNHYALFTPGLSASDLSTYNLQANDAVEASDHIPVIADFSIGNVNGTENKQSSLPSDFRLEQNYPNPFNPSTRITYFLPSEAKVSLAIYDALGKEIWQYNRNSQSPGKHSLLFNSQNYGGLSSGVYLLNFIATSSDYTYNSTKKILLMK